MEHRNAINRRRFIGSGIYMLLICLLSVSLLTGCRADEISHEDENGLNPQTPNIDDEMTDDFALVMLEAKAKELGIVKISDLTGSVAGTMNVSAPEEAYKGGAILEAMQEEYGVYFKNHIVHDVGEGYTVLKEGSGDAEIGVALVTSDDPALQKDDIRILKDDKEFFKK